MPTGRIAEAPIRRPENGQAALDDAELLIVGSDGGTHIGASFARAAARQGMPYTLFDAADAYRGSRTLQWIMWRTGRRPVQLKRFAESVVSSRAEDRQKKQILIATGAAPLTAAALRQLKAAGTRCINYSTDDPWNKAHRAPWHLQALPHYDVVFTPRRANTDDFRALGCTDVRYLPFAYDDELFASALSPEAVTAYDVLFVGGADRDRAAFMRAFMASGLRTALAGNHWHRFPQFGGSDLGPTDVGAMRRLTAAAAVNLCLVRRANRDGNVMRSFEIPAAGGFMAAEDTPEHREIFGPEGDCVLYFTTPQTAIDKVHWALAHPAERQRMARAAHQLITAGGQTYRDRLLHMLAAVR